MAYIVKRYAPDGHGGPDKFVGQVETLAEARAIVRDHLGVGRLHPARRWQPEDAEEGWHDHPPSHPRADGCGGYVIVGDCCRYCGRQFQVIGNRRCRAGGGRLGLCEN